MDATPPDNSASFPESFSNAAFASVASKAVSNIAEMLSEAEATLTSHDTIVGDGDCGITMKRSAVALLEALPTFATDKPSQLFLEIADCVSKNQGGTSGALFEIFCRAAALSLRAAQDGGRKPADGGMVTEAMCRGVDEVMAAGGAQVGYRTMVDALAPAVSAARLGLGVASIVAAAKAGAETTKEMRALAGRSNYVPFEQVRGVPDPGAVAVGIILEAIAKAC